MRDLSLPGDDPSSSPPPPTAGVPGPEAGDGWLRGRTVLVLGLGESGLAMARWCARLGATLRVWDSRAAPPLAARLAETVSGASWWRGPLVPDEALDGVAMVLKSPGLAPHDPAIAPLLARAAAIGLAVQGELGLFARALADLRASAGYAPRVLAVTGTNGKTTTTAMTAALVARTGRRVAVAGNIGPTMLQTLADALDREGPGLGQSVDRSPLPTRAERVDAPSPGEPVPDLVEPETVAASSTPASLDVGGSAQDEADGPGASPLEPVPPAPVFAHLPDVWVLELSSFQLHDARGFEPDAAALLNLTQDHLDWHGTMAAYAAAKGRVFGERTTRVVNRDDAEVEAQVAPPPETDTAGRGRSKARKPAAPARATVRFGTGAPRRAGDFGIVDENGMAWLVRARETDETLRPGRRRAGTAAESAPEDLSLQRLMPADALRVRGRHNAANALAALALATAIGCPLAPMLHALREYAGEPHRVEFVATVGGVDAFDDSKGTNVGATVAALLGLGTDRAPARLVVILGGDGKGQDFAPLADPVRRHARAVATLGRDAAAIEAALAMPDAAAIPLARLDTLEAATAWAFEQARPGDAVLLSPACASLDMFRNYAHRAEVFVAQVRAIAADRGEMV